MKFSASLLIGQALALGLAMAFLVVPGTALFLDSFGAENLPYVYLIVAVAGAAVSYSLTALQRLFGLFQLATGSTLVVAVAILVCWELLFIHGLEWATYPVLVLFALELQLGFVFIGAQAGSTFDVQELKRVFSRIVAGFVVGFMVGGFAGAAVSRQGWNAVHLLLASAATVTIMAALIAAAWHHAGRSAAAARGPEAAEDLPAPASLRQILRVPLIRAVFVYQVLSAIGSQLIEYLVYDRAAARYSGTQELAAFMGGYSAILNFVDLVVLVALGGFLMSRYGLRYGLAANPVTMTALVATAGVVALVSGPDATLFFFLVAAARILDVTLRDASARTSINATFVALPIEQRLAAQVSVEGAGVPLALGLTAILILVINALPGSTINEIAAAAFLVCMGWSISAVWVYRRYRTTIIAAARRRTLDGEALNLDEPATRGAVLSLLDSADPRDAAIGASILIGAKDREAAALIEAAAVAAPQEKQRALLGYLVDGSPDVARRISIDLVRSGAPELMREGLRTLRRAGGVLDPDLLRSLLDHPDLRVRADAWGAAMRDNGPASERASNELAAAAASEHGTSRRAAATAIAAAGWSPSVEMLARLLGDDDEAVRREAIGAVAGLNDPQRVEMLRIPMPPMQKARVIRACRAGASPEFCRVAAAELTKGGAHVSELVRLLGAAGWRPGDERAAIEGLARVEVERIATARDWANRIGRHGGGSRSTARLLRALVQERREAGRRLVDVLALLHDRRLIIRTGRVLENLVPGDKGLAIESLDIVLAPPDRRATIAALRAAFVDDTDPAPRPPVDGSALSEDLRALVEDCGWARHGDWLQACTIAAMREAGITAEASVVKPLGRVSAELMAPLAG